MRGAFSALCQALRLRTGFCVIYAHDRVVPIGASAMLSSKLVRKAQLKVYKGLPHGMATTQHDVINADLLAFLKA